MAVTGEARATQSRSRDADSGAEKDSAAERPTSALSAEQLLELYRKMILIRHFEEACQRAFRKGQDRWVSPPLHRAGSGGDRFPRDVPDGRPDHHGLP